MVGGGRTKTKLMLNSTQVEVEVEVGVELGKKMVFLGASFLWLKYCFDGCIVL